MGVKNHAVVMPNAQREATINALAGAAFGAAGQRCMAVSAAGFIATWRDALVGNPRSLNVNAGHEAGADVGPLISPEAKKRVEDLI